MNFYIQLNFCLIETVYYKSLNILQGRASLVNPALFRHKQNRCKSSFSTSFHLITRRIQRVKKNPIFSVTSSQVVLILYPTTDTRYTVFYQYV